MPVYGEKPGAGTYVCPNDGQRVILESDDEMLMECPSCDGMEFVRVGGKIKLGEGALSLAAQLGQEGHVWRAADGELKFEAK